MLLVAITCTQKDFSTNYGRLFSSIKNFYSVFSSEVFFLVVLQGRDADYDEASDLFLGFPDFSYSIKKASYLSVSHARNEALAFGKKNDFSSVIFHDSTLIYTRKYLLWLKPRLGKELISTSFEFTDKSEDDLVFESGRGVYRIFNDFRDIYVWSYVFPLDAFFPLFDVRFGPGEESVYSSGEDFLFMRSFFKLNPRCRKFLRYEGVGVVHPSRPKDYSKHLVYAEGQGKIHQAYILEERSVFALWRCIIFLGNAVFRVVLLKRNSIKILALRVKGFVDTKFKI